MNEGLAVRKSLVNVLAPIPFLPYRDTPNLSFVEVSQEAKYLE